MAETNEQNNKQQKTLTMPSAGKNVEQLECLEGTGRNVKWQSHFGKGFGRFL